MSLREALDRTLLLMRDEVHADVPDAVLVEALTGTRIALIADQTNLASHAAQTAFVTAAILMARSGHQVHLFAPNIKLVGAQPPLTEGPLLDALLDLGRDMLPGLKFECASTGLHFDLALALGDSPIAARTNRILRLNADAWAGMHTADPVGEVWRTPWWPFGAMAAGALAAGEAFKTAMHKLIPLARNPNATAELFAPTEFVRFALAPDDTPYASDLGRFDCVSGGAIVDAALYALARIPAVRGSGRIIEPDSYAISNLNRYVTLRRSRAQLPKARTLAEVIGLRLTPIAERLDLSSLTALGGLNPRVIVGVDDIPTRWTVQRAMPPFLAIGATTHWSAMASYHRPGLGCAQCLHPIDDPNDAPIPTTACVSFWAGLLTATYLLRDIAERSTSPHEQQIYLTSFRPEHPYRAAVLPRPSCPTCASFEARKIA
ncbi:MAG: hypothetical protein EKK41_17310 [Hyphomicrobiales bacterium]|nr:MAG: hypothetical protein EKK41_17310 [Hyphomicrobiales bacterium]